MFHGFHRRRWSIIPPKKRKREAVEAGRRVPRAQRPRNGGRGGLTLNRESESSVDPAATASAPSFSFARAQHRHPPTPLRCEQPVCVSTAGTASSRTCCNDLLHQKLCLWAEEIYRPRDGCVMAVRSLEILAAGRRQVGLELRWNIISASFSPGTGDFSVENTNTLLFNPQ